MKTAAIIQARMGSTRLPEKVLLNLCGKSVLAHVVERVRVSRAVDEIVVATTDRQADDAIAAAAAALGATPFRGSEEDVLSRYYLAAVESRAETIVRITADCPLFDGELLRAMLAEFTAANRPGQSARIDYLSNTLTRTYPRGLDAEIFTFAALEQAYRAATRPSEREHVTPFIYSHPQLFNLRNFAADHDYSRYRWTLDTEDDWRLIEAIYGRLYHRDRLFGTRETLALLEREPALAKLNAHVTQKAAADV